MSSSHLLESSEPPESVQEHEPKPFWTEIQQNLEEVQILDLTKERIFSNDMNRHSYESSLEKSLLLGYEDLYEDYTMNEDNVNSNNFQSKKGDFSLSSFMEFNNKVMFPQSGLLLNDVIEMVMAFSIAFGLTSEGQNYLIEMLKICAGDEFKYLQLSDYVLNKLFHPPSDKTKYYFYCEKCEKQVVHSSTKEGIKNQKKKCINCESEIIVSLSSNAYFLSVDFKYQMEILLHDKKVRDCIINKLESETVTECDNSIRDIQDGQLYKAVHQLHPKTIMYIISTDGAPLPSGLKKGFWPLQIVLIDIDKKIRYKIVLLVGIMIIDHEPKPDLMNLFIEAFNEQALLLHKEGITFAVSENGVRKEYHFTLTPLCVIADSVARPVLQNRVQYNGYYGCSYCYLHGTYCKSVKYPFLELDSELRTHVSYMKDALLAEEKKHFVRGVKGRSAFCKLTTLDMVWSFALDPMHNGILGVTVQLWDLWFKLLTPSQRRLIDDLLLLIKPPRDLYRLPGKLSNRSNWKAAQWKAWLFYYSIPILYGILSNEIMEHYALFLNSMYALSKEFITEVELDKCEEDLIVFVARFEQLYGLEAMTFNVHVLLHLVENVRRTGPLWATSAVAYERNIYLLKRTLNGSKGAAQQMTKKTLQRLSYKYEPRPFSVHDAINNFCESVFYTKRFTTNVKTINNVTFFGERKVADEALEKQFFYRCFYRNQIYSSVKYTRTKKFDDTIILLKTGEIAQIKDIYLFNDDTCWFVIEKFITEQFTIGTLKISHIWEIKARADCSTILISDVQSKMVKLDVSDKKYVCNIPNCIELQ